jgi:aminopeptidase N
MPLLKRLIPLLLAFIPATGWCLDLQYDLEVKINPGLQEIAGAGVITSATSAEFALSVAGLQEIKINDRPVTPDGNQKITIRMEAKDRLRIIYRAVFENTRQGYMDTGNIFLTGRWYPQPAEPVRYNLSVTLPEKFIAVSESDTVSIEKHPGRTTFNFHFEKPLDGLHLAASTNYTVKKERHEGIDIEAYFFKADAALADTYINYTKKYLSMYAKMLTPYPYKRFAIVENIFPTGYSMPTFTLLGREVVKLPFIVKTSLGHEILHQWFGNSVYIDYSHGNWAEGITNYLADHHYADLDARGKAYRKQILINYQAYVNTDTAMPLTSFISRANKAQAAIGYGKAAMMFHMLRERFGDRLFFDSLRELIRNNTFRMASWHDIQRAFEKTTGKNLYAFFGQWLNRKDVPDLAIEDAGLKVEGGQLTIRFRILQNGEPFRLRLPVTVKTARGRTTRVIDLNTRTKEVFMNLDAPPTEVLIDGDYSIMRTLDRAEQPPVLADIMGRSALSVAAPNRQRAAYKPLIDALGVRKVTWLDPEKVTFATVKAKTLIIAGFDNPLVDMLMGGLEPPDEGVRLKVLKNPYDSDKRLLLLHVKNRAESKTVTRKLAHYGKYSELAFTGGRITYKATAKSRSGIPVLTRPAPAVVRPGKQETLDDIFAELLKSRVIFVGEQHDRFAHHINQLLVIKKLHAAGLKFGVGMEMFQKPYQSAIDDYLAARTDERTFLTRSDYYNKWRYDYNLYKPIIDFLKENRIPLVALNIEGHVTRKTAREGIDGLSKKQRRQVPDRLDFSDEQYREDLYAVFSTHGQDAGLDDFMYFLQSQTLWDETMAASAAEFLNTRPDHKLVVLAGNGHVRFKYGIPQRLYRRVKASYSVIVQDDEVEDGIADYILFTTDIEGVKAPKLGVMVEEKEEKLLVKSVIEHGPAGKAGVAAGDIITAFDGHRIKTLADLKIALFFTKIGDRIRLEVDRDGTILEKEVELKAHPKHIPRLKK